VREELGSGSAPLVTTLTAWAAGLRLDDVPERVVALATSQVIAQLAAIRAGLRHSAGAKLVRAFGPPLQSDPRCSAAVLAVLGSWLNLDDTAYAGHLAPSTVAVPLAYAHAGRRDGRTLLAAVIAANECAARITADAVFHSVGIRVIKTPVQAPRANAIMER
jgi:2-methylcitrate dehydratase PrpD